MALLGNERSLVQQRKASQKAMDRPVGRGRPSFLQGLVALAEAGLIGAADDIEAWATALMGFVFTGASWLSACVRACACAPSFRSDSLRPHGR